MARSGLFILVPWLIAGAPAASAEPVAQVRCDAVATADVAVDGLLDDWGREAVTRAGRAPDGALALRCGWDGAALVLALEVTDERVVRVRGKGDEDRVTLRVSAGKAPVVIDVRPASATAQAVIQRPAKVLAADSLQPRGFSIEARIPAAQLAGLGPSTPSLDLAIVFHDSDRATGGDAADIAITGAIELPDRKDLLDEFLRAVALDRRQVRLDTLVELDPARPGTERVVAGGTVIGVLTDQYAYVALPVERATDVLDVALLPLGAKQLQVVAARVRQGGADGSRDLLLLWTVRGGQLQPLAQLEVRKAHAGNVLESTWSIARGPANQPELRVVPRPAVGWSADTWSEVPAPDAEPILLPWDPARSGVAFTLRGTELVRRDLPAPRARR